MPSILNEALEWFERAEQAREVAGQLADPSARKAVLELAERDGNDTDDTGPVTTLNRSILRTERRRSGTGGDDAVIAPPAVRSRRRARRKAALANF